MDPNIAPQAVVLGIIRARPPVRRRKWPTVLVDGYPNDETREWVTGGEGVERVDPDELVVAAHHRLRSSCYDRPNASTSSSPARSSSVMVPRWQSDRCRTMPARHIHLPARSISSLRLTVTQVSASTNNVGLAEFQVFEAGWELLRSPMRDRSDGTKADRP